MQLIKPVEDKIEEERYLVHCEAIGRILASNSKRVDELIAVYIKLIGVDYEL